MKCNALTVTGVTSIIFFQLSILASATCQRFSPSGDIVQDLNGFKPDHYAPAQQISAPFHCPADGPQKLYTCASQPMGFGCQVRPQSAIVLEGSVNVTLSHGEQQSLFDLVDENLSKLHKRHLRIFNKLEGCMRPHNALDYWECVGKGTTTYLQAVPAVYCTEGTVTQCDKEGSLTDGAAVRVCGGQLQRFSHLPKWRFKVQHINASEADQYEHYPGYNAEGQKICDRLDPRPNGATGQAVVSWASLGVAAVVTMSNGFFI